MVKILTYKSIMLWAALSAFLFTGCGEADNSATHAIPSEAIRFAPSVTSTRCSLIHDIPDEGVMSISCVRQNVLDNTYNYYFQNIDYILSATTPRFANGNTYWWWREEDTEYHFYAFYPSQGENVQFTTDGPKLTYIAERDGSSPDLMAAESLGYSSDYENVVALSFHHILSGVRFKVTDSTPAGRITGLQIQNICFTASYCAGNWGEYTNNNHTTVKEFDVPGNGTELLIPATGYEYMVLPQTCSSSSCLVLTFTDSYPNAGYAHYFSLPLDGFTFEAGKGYTFVIDGALTQITVNCLEDSTGAVMDSWTTKVIYAEDTPANRDPYTSE